MAQKPITEQLEAATVNHAYVLRVSIHTEVGQALGARYNFVSTPLFVLLNRRGEEIWRGAGAPTADQVLRER